MTGRLVRLTVQVALLLVATIAVPIADAHGSPATGGDQLWEARYEPFFSPDRPYAVAMSPDGTRVFVTGVEGVESTGWDYGTVAYDASNGHQLWAMHFNGPGVSVDEARALAVSPDGSKVFVTGGTRALNGYFDYGTIAYAAATGSQLWVAIFDGDEHRGDWGRAIAVSPEGSLVFVTGNSHAQASANDFVTIAYDATTGASVWERTYTGVGHRNDRPTALAVSPDGSKLFVTGFTAVGSAWDYATVAYDAVTAQRLWIKHYGPLSDTDGATALAVSPDGSTVFVTGDSTVAGLDYLTIAYDAATGARKWAHVYNGPGLGDDHARSIAVSPDGSKVFVTGFSPGSGTLNDYATAAYDSTNGFPLWVSRYDGGCESNDLASAVGVSTDGSKVFVTGSGSGCPGTRDYVTIAYDSLNGGQLWLTRYDGLGMSKDSARALAVSPDGTKVMVTGASIGEQGAEADYATVAYEP